MAQAFIRLTVPLLVCSNYAYCAIFLNCILPFVGILFMIMVIMEIMVIVTTMVVIWWLYFNDYYMFCVELLLTPLCRHCREKRRFCNCRHLQSKTSWSQQLQHMVSDSWQASVDCDNSSSCIATVMETILVLLLIYNVHTPAKCQLIPACGSSIGPI